MMEASAGTLSGRYETGEKLGTGGMSNVYKATDLILERTVAVKVLAEHLSDDERFIARFRREALAVAKLIHPNIVQVYDTGVDEGRHYIVMEYVEGRSGAQILQRHGAVEPEVAAEIGIQACAGLDYAHRRGIIHRDVKPGNLMIVGGPVGGGEMIVKLTDFGIARAIEQTRITQVGSVVGTAAYLAPEQVRGEEATPATDVYALGVVLYQFLTGRLPYEGSSLAELAVRQQNEKPLPPDTYNSEVPETLGAAVLRALEGDPSRRYASADELAAGLRLGLEGGDVTLPLGDDGTAATNVLGGDTAATRHMGRDTAQTEYRPAQSQTRRPQPRVAPAPPPAPAAPAPRAAQPRSRSAFSRFVRFVLAAVALVLVAAAVATAVIVTTDKAAGVKVSRVAGDTIDKVVEEVKELVRNNTE
jgi:eukaryotic-like serine/threonine-protein kinase